MTHQYTLPLPHREAMEAEDFLVTPSNREAVGWLDRWPDWPAPCLTLYGPSGSGKTHLAQVWQARAGATGLTHNDLAATEGPRGGAAFTLDDAEQMVGNAVAEESLFHLYNRLRESGGFLLLTAATPPAQWGIVLPDLRSRILAAPAVALGVPDDELLIGLLIKQFRDRQIAVGEGVLTFLLLRVERSPAALRALVERLDRESLAEGRRITIPLVRQILGQG